MVEKRRKRSKPGQGRPKGAKAKVRKKQCPKICTKEEVIGALVESGGNMSEAARVLKISFMTIWNYRRDWPELNQVIAESRKVGNVRDVDRAIVRLADKVEQGDVRAICYTLSTLGKSRGFRQEKRHKHSNDPRNPLPGAQDISVSVNVADLGLPLEVREQVLEALKRRQELEEQKRNAIEVSREEQGPPEAGKEEAEGVHGGKEA